MHEITEIDGNKIATLPLTISAFLRNMHLHYSYLVSDSSIPEKMFKDLKYIEYYFWISILLDDGICFEINVLTSNFILLGDH